jgi:signal transduction histidine kinase
MVMGMILLITVSARAVECASALRESTSEDVEWANGLQHAIAALRKQDFSAVILDEAVLELDSDGGDVLLRHCGTAVPIFVNLAISGQQRLVREVRTALRRRAEDEARARQAAEAELRHELNGPLTALLLSCQLALEDSAVPAHTVTKIRSIYEMASEIRAHIGLEEAVHQ